MDDYIATFQLPYREYRVTRILSACALLDSRDDLLF
jgi:hypothetical protein